MTEVKTPKYFNPPSGTNAEDFIIYYKYNTLGQLIAKSTPDLDGDGDGNPLDERLNNPDIRYKYDKLGNIRFIEDPNRRKKNEIIFYSYDDFKRKIKEGVAAISNWEDLDPDITQSFESNSALIEYDYDGNNAYQGAKNLKGRLSRIKYKTDDEWSYTYFSYDDEGNIEWIVQNIKGLEKKIEYEYNLQGNVIKISYDKDGPDEFYFWYEYNELGHLEKVFSNGLDIQPQNTDAMYEYWPSGKVKELKLGEKSDHSFAETLGYTYSERDWLSSINAANSIYEAATDNHKFGLKLYYHTPGLNGIPQYNGNISAAEYYTDRGGTTQENPSGSYLHRYEYNYDELNRLMNANYYYDESLSQWLSTDAYHVNLSYDIIGNINILTRNNENGSGNPYTYYYKANSNRLDYVEGYNSQSSNNYNYDENGNLIKDISKRVTNATYDYRNLITSVEDGALYTNITYAYDYNGNRVYKKYDGEGSSSGYIYIRGKNGKTLAVYDLDGNLLFFNLYGLDLIGQITK